MRFENTAVYGMKEALRGMRNPKASWDRTDSILHTDSDGNQKVTIGKNDLDLATRLIRAGGEHRKFMRQIMVTVDITAPIYWWKEFDTYKVGTTANSTSTMHKLSSTPIKLDCFEIDDYNPDLVLFCSLDGIQPDITMADKVKEIILVMEQLRVLYNNTKDDRYWKELIRWLPESWQQTRTVTMSYENLYAIAKQRKGHKLTEWRTSFIDWIHTLDNADLLIFCG